MVERTVDGIARSAQVLKELCHMGEVKMESKLVAEAIGTFALTFIGAGSIIVGGLDGGSADLLTVAMAHGIVLAIDGQIRISIDHQTQIQISQAQHFAQLVNLPGNGYFKTLRTKMGWLGNVR